MTDTVGWCEEETTQPPAFLIPTGEQSTRDTSPTLAKESLSVFLGTVDVTGRRVWLRPSYTHTGCAITNVDSMRVRFRSANLSGSAVEWPGATALIRGSALPTARANAGSLFTRLHTQVASSDDLRSRGRRSNRFPFRWPAGL